MEPRTSFTDADFRPKHKLGVQCYRCGKVIKSSQNFRVVHIIDPCNAVHPADDHMVQPNEDWFAVGMDCARKIGMEFTHAPDALPDTARAGGNPITFFQ